MYCTVHLSVSMYKHKAYSGILITNYLCYYGNNWPADHTQFAPFP